MDIRVSTDPDSLATLRSALERMFACEARHHQAIARHKVLQYHGGDGSFDADDFADVLAGTCAALCTARGEVLALLVAGGQEPGQFAMQRLAENYTGAQLVALSQDPTGGAAHGAHLDLWDTRRDLLMRHLTEAVALVCRDTSQDP